MKVYQSVIGRLVVLVIAVWAVGSFAATLQTSAPVALFALLATFVAGGLWVFQGTQTTPYESQLPDYTFTDGLKEPVEDFVTESPAEFVDDEADVNDCKGYGHAV